MYIEYTPCKLEKKLYRACTVDMVYVHMVRMRVDCGRLVICVCLL